LRCGTPRPGGADARLPGAPERPLRHGHRRRRRPDLSHRPQRNVHSDAYRWALAEKSVGNLLQALEDETHPEDSGDVMFLGDGNGNAADVAMRGIRRDELDKYWQYGFYFLGIFLYIFFS
jgi:hypothetical protein